MFARILAVVISLFTAIWTLTANAELADTVQKIKPSVVGVGIYTPLGRPQNVIRGTGFVIGDGNHIVTNSHVLPDELDSELRQEMVVFIGSGKNSSLRRAKVVADAKEFDLAVLKIEGKPLPSMTLAGSDFIREGSYIAFTGFPIGAVLGLYPVTHRGIVASITPSIVPVADSGQLNIQMLKRLRNPYMVYQLDATAYPGNSGSAMYDQKTGEVIGVINKVFVQETKEAVISKPSGITYAIPVKHLRDLLNKHKITF